jgi:hypothetical protein
MSKTTNLGLELTTSDATTFASWRTAQNGEGAGTEESPLSNAQIIDNFAGAIYGVSGTTTLYSGSWSSNTYNISVASLGEYDAIFFSPITALDKSYLETANIIITTSGTTVTFTCVTSPTNNIGLNYFIARGKQ